MMMADKSSAFDDKNLAAPINFHFLGQMSSSTYLQEDILKSVRKPCQKSHLFGLNFTDAKFGQYHTLSRGQTLNI